MLVSQNIFKENRPVFLKKIPESPDSGSSVEAPSEVEATTENTVAIGKTGPLKVGEFVEVRDPGSPDTEAVKITNKSGGKYILEDGSKVWKDEVPSFGPGVYNEKTGKVELEHGGKPILLREKGGKTYTIEGDPYDPMGFTPSEHEISEDEVLSLEEAKAKVDSIGAKARAKLEKQLKETPNIKKEDLEKMIAEGNAKIDAIILKAKTKIDSEESILDGKIFKNVAKEIQKSFLVETIDQLDLSEKELKAKQVIKKGKDSLFKWLKTPENRLYMRKLVFTGWDGAGIPKGPLKTNFSNVKTALNLDSKGYKTVWRYLRIGNLFETNQLKHINGVQKKSGSKLEPAYFTKGGPNHREGVYTKKLKYCSILDGTKIFFSDKPVLEEMKKDEGDHQKEYKKLEAKKAASSGSESTSKSATKGAKAKVSEEVAEDLQAAADEGEEKKPDILMIDDPDAFDKINLTTEPREIKPLKPSTKKSKKVQEFNGIKYVPNGTKEIDLIDPTGAIIDTVPKANFEVIKGREAMTEDFMMNIAKKEFPYFKVEPKVSEQEDDSNEFYITFEDEDNNSITLIYNIQSGRARHGERDSLCGDITKLLKDTSPEAISKLLILDINDFKTSDFGNIEENIKDKLAQSLVNKDWKGVFTLIGKGAKATDEAVALAVQGVTETNFNTLDVDLKLSEKLGSRVPKIAKVLADKGYDTENKEVKVLEFLSGGKLSDETISAVLSPSDLEWTNAIDYLYANYPENEFVKSRYYEDLAERTEELSKSHKSMLIAFHKNPPKSLSNKAVIALYEARSEVANLTATDFGEVEDLAAEKTKLTEALKKSLKKYLEKVSDQTEPANFEDIYEFTYSSDGKADYDFSKAPKQTEAGARVLARYLVLKGITLFESGVIDGSKDITVDEAEKCIKHYLKMEGAKVPSYTDVESQTVLARKVYEVCKSVNTPLATMISAMIQHVNSTLEFIGKDAKGQTTFDNLLKIVEGKGNPKTKLEASELLAVYANKYSLPAEKKVTLRHHDDKGREVKPAKAEFDTWLANKKVEIAVEAGGSEIDDLVVDDIKDEDLKEFVAAYKDPSTITSVDQVRKLARTKGVTPETLMELAEKTEPTSPGRGEQLILSSQERVELYLAVGMRGEAADAMGKMPETSAEKYYYQALTKTKKSERKAALETAVKKIDVEFTDKTIQIAIFEAFAKDGYVADYDKLTTLAGEEIPTDNEYDARAILKARLLRARFELYQCMPRDQLPENFKANAMSMSMGELPEGVEAGEAKCEPDALVSEMESYIEAQENLKKEDYALLLELYKVYHKEGESTWKDDLTEASQTKYQNLMLELASYTGNKKYLEGVKKDSFDSDADAKAKYMALYGSKFDVALLKAQSSEKKVEEIKKLLKSKSSKEEKVKIAVALRSENAFEAAKIYLSLGKDYENEDGTNGVLIVVGMIEDGELTEGQTKGLVDDIADAGYVDRAATICEEEGLGDILLDKIYKKHPKADVDVSVLIGAGIDVEKVLEFLKTDSRLNSKFKIPGETQTEVETFYKQNETEIKDLPDNERKVIEIRLGQIEQSEEYAPVEAVEAPAEAEEAPDEEPAPEEAAEAASESAPEVVPEKPKHKYTLSEDKKSLTIEGLGDEPVTYVLDLDEGLSSMVSSEGDLLNVFNEDSEIVAKIKFDNNDGSFKGDAYGEYEDKYLVFMTGDNICVYRGSWISSFGSEVPIPETLKQKFDTYQTGVDFEEIKAKILEQGDMEMGEKLDTFLGELIEEAQDHPSFKPEMLENHSDVIEQALLKFIKGDREGAIDILRPMNEELKRLDEAQSPAETPESGDEFNDAKANLKAM